MMERGKIVAVITGAIAVALSLVYLLIVQLLDFRGEMLPAPIGWLSLQSVAASIHLNDIRIARSASPAIHSVHRLTS
jgi:hypothetical protein